MLVVTILILDFVMIHWIRWIQWHSFRKNSIRYFLLDSETMIYLLKKCVFNWCLGLSLDFLSVIRFTVFRSGYAVFCRDPAIDLENMYRVTRRKRFYFVNKPRNCISTTKSCIFTWKLQIYQLVWNSSVGCGSPPSQMVQFSRRLLTNALGSHNAAYPRLIL